MKTALIYTIIGLLAINSLTAQVKIGDTPQNLNPASLLELESTSRALVITRVTDAQMSSISPLRGALVYNTDQNCLHYYDGTAWINICEALDDSFTVSTRDDYMSQLYSNTLDSTVVITTTDNGDGSTNYNFEVGEITGSNIQDFSIEGRDIVNRTIAGDKIASRSVNPLRIFNDGDDLTRQVLLWNGNVAPDGEWQRIAESDLQISEADGVIGNEVVDVTDGTLTRSGNGDAGDPYTLGVSPLGITENELANNAVTSGKIRDGEIIDADISATAAILGTKINPNFGALNVATTGTLGAGNTTITGNLSTTGTATIGANTITNVDGTTGQVLTTDGTGNTTWQDPSPTAVETTTAIDGNGLTGNPLDLAADAVTTDKILDGEIVDADISTTAAILGTKIDPDFGALNVATTGTLAAGNTTITGDLSTTGTATIGANTVTNVDGTTGQVLTTDGSGTATWQDPSPTAVQTTTAIDGDGLAGNPLDLADDAVTTDKILNGTILEEDIANEAVTPTKILPGIDGQVLTTFGGNASWQTPLTAAVIGVGHVNSDASSVTTSTTIANVVHTTDPGLYTVTFNSSITNNYLVQLTIDDTTPGIIQVANRGTNSFQVLIFNTGGNPANLNWQFTVIQYIP